jgi:hypothetical protein
MTRSAKLRLNHVFDVRFYVILELSMDIIEFALERSPVLINPLTLELNPSAQRCLTRFFTGNFLSLTVHFVNI